MEFLYLLEDIRVPVLNEFMLLITRLGEETAFLVIALIVFWCVDKYQGYYVLGVGLLGTLANQFLKITCRVLRPWDLDRNFTILEEAREAASGYSFPSGHTQTAVGTFGSVAAVTKRKSMRIICIVIAALVGFSRMYVGVHTPADVLVGGAMAVALVLALKPMSRESGRRYIPLAFGVMLVLSLGFLAYVELYPFPADMQMENYESAVKNAYTLIGCLSGILIVFILDERKLRFSTKAVWWAQILKVLCGLAAVLAVKEGLRAPLEALFSGHMVARAVRYFLIVIVAGAVWPMTFRYFSKLGKKAGAKK